LEELWAGALATVLAMTLGGGATAGGGVSPACLAGAAGAAAAAGALSWLALLLLPITGDDCAAVSAFVDFWDALVDQSCDLANWGTHPCHANQITYRQ